MHIHNLLAADWMYKTTSNNNCAEFKISLTGVFFQSAWLDAEIHMSRAHKVSLCL